MSNYKQFFNAISNSDIDYILNLPEVIVSKRIIDNEDCKSLYFFIKLPIHIKQNILDSMNLNLFNIDEIPMRWIKDDTSKHIDTNNNNTSFNDTYLIYLTDNPGQLILNDRSYSISQGTGYVFSEGISHETINTSTTSRLLIGPMNEIGVMVGIPYDGNNGILISIPATDEIFNLATYNSSDFAIAKYTLTYRQLVGSIPVSTIDILTALNKENNNKMNFILIKK